MKRIFSLFLLCVASCGLFAQQANSFTNNGATITVTPGTTVWINEDSLNNISGTINNSGRITIVADDLFNSDSIINTGYIHVQGALTNNALISGTGDSIIVYGNWVNNGTYTGNNSLVDLNGGDPNTQYITGSAITNFNNLTLDQGGLKRQTINATASGILALNTSELATDVNQMLVTNTNPSAITFTPNMGFVSSANPGNLAWNTSSTSNYLFPTGYPSYLNNGSVFIRPIQFTPVAANNDMYQATLVKGDPSNAGYSVNSLDDSLCAVNSNFYHLLGQPTGTDAAALTMFYDPASDDNWTDEAHWATPTANVWNYLGLATTGTSSGYNTVTVNGVSNFVPAPFALARKRFTVYAGPSQSITMGQSTTLTPVISTPSYDSISWTPDFNLSCDTCRNPVASPTVNTLYTVSVFEGQCSAMSSVQINVAPNQLLVPTGFSPNGDNVNNYFHILNTNLSKVDLQVFNRWGEKIYETTDANDRGWDGTFQGIKQEMGVYVWECQYEFAGTSQLLTAKGNVTLLR